MDYNTPAARQEIPPSCVVGIGASAGGLEALQQFLTFLPANTGMAFVIIQHLAPDHKSLLAEILGKYTSMPVSEAKDGERVRRNHVYMIPPKYNIEIVSDVLRLQEYDHTKINHPIDIFFRSLAEAYQNRAVTVILSGTGSDGTNGIRSIKEKNGLIIVQSPESAKFDGMPRNAIATGFVDLVQNPEGIAREMSHISSSMADQANRLQLTDDDLMSQVFSILRDVTNIDYTYYKQTTILRRIERRMVVTHCRNLQEYVNYLKANPDETKILAKEVLIGVTSFFRDPEYFEVLKENVIRPLVQRSTKANPIRVWVAGCSTGEEAYSIAILFSEVLEELNFHREIKIFATDLDADAISTASRGIYGDNIIEDVSVARLSKYFSRRGNKYSIRPDIRKMIIFAQHNVFQDPPFGKLDLISCRNLLIYFQSVLQKQLFGIFHMALKDGGYLFLGRSESIFDYDDIFRVLCANEKIFVHNASGKEPPHTKITYSMQGVMDSPLAYPVTAEKQELPETHYDEKELDTAVLENIVPTSVLVNGKNELCRTYGDSSEFMTIPRGNATLDIFSLLREDLKIAVSTGLKESRQRRDAVTFDKVPVSLKDGMENIAVTIQPMKDLHGADTEYSVISFIRGRQKLVGEVKQYQVDIVAARRISDLEKELKSSQDNLRKTVAELESVNAELQAANEELLTANEELQSSNEELQSVNEELYTVNSEYQSKVNELADLNDDMANFLSTTSVGIIMVDRDLNIRKFTEYIATEFNIANQDVGRSLRYIAYNFPTIDMIGLCRSVMDSMKPVEQLCASSTGKTYMLRIAPYHKIAQNHTPDDRTDRLPESADADSPGDSAAGSGKDDSRLQGLVITFVDTTKQVDDQKQIDEMAKALRRQMQTNKEQEAFLSNMSHDMRTPMTAILGLTELTLQDRSLSDDSRDNLEKILDSGRYLISLIEEILETSRINAGKVVPSYSVVNEKDVADEAAGIAQEQARENDIHFRYSITGCQERYAMIDAEHVERILLNLLNNAIKFTPAGGNVSLSVHAAYTDDKVTHTYIVRDDGRGISPAFQQSMFLPFRQETADEGARSGTGLGLYICKNLVDILGGTITCESDIGKGSVFTVTLTYSLATDDQIRLRHNSASTYEDHILLGKNVLIAEDNHTNAEVIIRILATKGVHADVASDGQEAIDLFLSKGAYHYQAILMDLMMPVKGGLQATREIRKSDQKDARDIPIIALTADVLEETRQRCLDAGMTDFLAKPIEPADLLGMLAIQFEKENQENHE
ncbi:MAG: chemotaxis protein CheB [Lachnospiraceae bacterium]|jgi:two-component system CheB/CheR fusion protein